MKSGEVGTGSHDGPSADGFCNRAGRSAGPGPRPKASLAYPQAPPQWQPAVRGCLRDEDKKGWTARPPDPKGHPVQLIFADPRSPKEDPDKLRQSKSTP
ncbi:hypothetical protein B5P45_19480 [Phyllobacterium zundukense]|uniref:Uncharacterized protein n=1 Tax=Phyllobacterium zundukense TaxID=1867719 RepID=A0A2N9VUT9_9HYPH|nr:hypothetical protein B5P45_19480 [Phyllobacterium zundukense]